MQDKTFYEFSLHDLHSTREVGNMNSRTVYRVIALATNTKKQRVGR